MLQRRLFGLNNNTPEAGAVCDEVAREQPRAPGASLRRRGCGCTPRAVRILLAFGITLLLLREAAVRRVSTEDRGLVVSLCGQSAACASMSWTSRPIATTTC